MKFSFIVAAPVLSAGRAVRAPSQGLRWYCLHPFLPTLGEAIARDAWHLDTPLPFFIPGQLTHTHTPTYLSLFLANTHTHPCLSLFLANSHTHTHAHTPTFLYSCPSPTAGVHPDSCHRVSDAIQPSHPLSSPSPPSPIPSQPKPTQSQGSNHVDRDPQQSHFIP